jgi:hypothetical protein
VCGNDIGDWASGVEKAPKLDVESGESSSERLRLEPMFSAYVVRGDTIAADGEGCGLPIVWFASRGVMLGREDEMRRRCVMVQMAGWPRRVACRSFATATRGLPSTTTTRPISWPIVILLLYQRMAITGIACLSYYFLRT